MDQGVKVKLDQLSYFVETAKQEHIGKASRILAISPSAISHSISSLEEELGQKLFEKKGKSIFLTPHGKCLLERAEELLQLAQSIKEEISSDSIELSGTFRLAASHLLCTENLLPAWLKVQKIHPKIQSEIYTLRSAEVGLHKVAKSDSWGLFPDYLIHSKKSALKEIVHPDSWKASFQIAALHHRRRPLGAVMKALLGVLGAS